MGRSNTEYRRIAAKALGRPLTSNEVVHHIDGDYTNNANSNLLICTNDYHIKLHMRLAIAGWTAKRPVRLTLANCPPEMKALLRVK